MIDHAQRERDLSTLNQSIANLGAVSTIKALRALTGLGLKEAMDIQKTIFAAMQYAASNAAISNPECTKPERVVIIENDRVVESLDYSGAISDAMNMAQGTVDRDPDVRVQVARVIAESKRVVSYSLEVL